MDKVIAIGTLTGSSLPLRLRRFDGDVLGKIVADTWTPPGTGPASGCRGLRPCMLLNCTTGETVSQRGTVVSACTFTLAGISNATCGPFTFSSSGNSYSITVEYAGFTALNGSYVTTTYEHPSNCQVYVNEVTHNFSGTIKYVQVVNGGAPFSNTCNVTMTVTIRPHLIGGQSYGAEIDILCINPDVPTISGFEYRFYRSVLQTIWPCTNPLFGVSEPNTTSPLGGSMLKQTFDGRGGGAYVCGFKGQSPIISAYHANSGCNPFASLVISRTWS